jgi:DNA repair protein RecO (recombination protein O)
MLHKTRGLVLSYVKYRDTSVIVKIYTEAFGVQSYIENGARSAKGKHKMALLQPMTLLDLVVYHKKGKDIHRISEMRCARPFQSLPYDFYKSSIALFINELLNKTLKEEVGDEVLFRFLYDSLGWLDAQAGHFEHFPLQFMTGYMVFLGFYPQSGLEIVRQLEQQHLPIEDSRTAQWFDQLLDSQWDRPPALSRAVRDYLLHLLLFFYKIHLEDLGEIKSLAVLKEMLQ